MQSALLPCHSGTAAVINCQEGGTQVQTESGLFTKAGMKTCTEWPGDSSYLATCCDKILGKVNLGMGGFILSHSLGCGLHGRKSWRRSPSDRKVRQPVTVHPSSGGREQWVLVFSVVSLHLYKTPVPVTMQPSQEWVIPTHSTLMGTFL